MDLNKFLFFTLLILSTGNGFSQIPNAYLQIDKDTKSILILGKDEVFSGLISKKSGCFVPYYIRKEKTKLTLEDCLSYDMCLNEHFDAIILNNIYLIHFIRLGKSMSVVFDTLKLSSQTSLSDIKKGFQDTVLNLNEGLNMLMDKDEDFFEKNQNRIQHCYIKENFFNTIQLIFIDQRLRYIYIFPDNLEFKWDL